MVMSGEGISHPVVVVMAAAAAAANMGQGGMGFGSSNDETLYVDY